ncbi:MAG: GIY-YIG nuclease family protein [Candidatus Gracilibacteria bacterium]|nr:GIY-YIG nuclease family protein [Candidatus Gracilibacteria bacterium]
MNNDKTLQLTFYKGETSGIKILGFTKGELIGFYIPKILFNNELLTNPYLKGNILNFGIYFLIGDEIYIGQAKNLHDRLKGHIREGKKEFKDIICFTTTNNTFDDGDINFLEKTIIEIADKKGDFNLMNLKDGNNSNVKEFRKSNLNEYIEEIKFLLNVLGYRFLEELKKTENKNENSYYIEKPECKAELIYNENGFVVLSGSYGKNNETNSMLSGYKRLKRELINELIIEIRDDKLIFKKDYSFSSPTAPAQILLGYSVSGPQVWKNKDGKTIFEIENKKLS